MSEVSRRDVVKLAAGLAVGSGMATAGSALGQEATKSADAPQAPKVVDEALSRARDNPESFMLSEPELLALDGDGFSRDLYIASARDQDGKSVRVRVPSRSIRIFRADAGVDGFTRQGGLRWSFREKEGTVQLKRSEPELGTQPGSGPLVMVVRDQDTVRFYTMTYDLRC